MKSKIQKALIYNRVSSKKQVTEGHGLDSQELRCREYAANKGYEVAAVFSDDVTGEGDFMKRPGMAKLLRYLDDHMDEQYVVIFDDLKRYARDTVFHLKLRNEMALRNATRECLNFKFEDSPEGEFIETVLAAQSQLERQQNSRQTRQKMQARIQNGYWVFQPPLGYKYARSQGRGKILVRDEPIASVIQEALEGFAEDRFLTRADAMRFFQDNPLFPKDSRGIVRNQRVTGIFDQWVYAGFIEAPSWGISRRMGQHEPLVSAEVWQRIQDKLNGKVQTPRQTNLNEDFPLRGYVACAECGTPLTACWSRGTHKRYAYYLCPNRTGTCSSYGKSIRREKIEGEFEELLQSLQPSESLFIMASAMFKDLWNHRLSQGEVQVKALGAQLGKIEKQVSQLLERILDASVPSVIAAYENRIQKLEEEKLLIAQRMVSGRRPANSFEQSLRTALGFLASPSILWKTGQLEDRRTVVKLAFADRLSYARNEGFRTANLALPFKVLGAFRDGESKMARPTGFEPVAFSSGG